MDDFDFFDVLQGRTYPTDTVTVIMDEKGVYDFVKAQREFEAKTDPTDEEISTHEELLRKLHADIEASKATFSLQGIPDDEITSCKEIADAHFADKKKQKKAADGTIVRYLPEEENVNYMNYFNAVVFSKHITQVIRHKDDRTTTSPGVDWVAHFMDKAPGFAKDKLTEAIRALRVNSSEYEAGLDEGFFLKS